MINQSCQCDECQVNRRQEPDTTHYADDATLARIAELERKNAALQARIDELMLEHCPDEMTQEQIDNYAKHQQPVDAETEAAIDAAIASEKENERG